MKKPIIQRNSEAFYVDTSAGRLSANEVGVLEQMAMLIEQNEPRPAEFLKAWKDAVELGGEHLFTVRSESVQAATDKDQLRPYHDMIVSSQGFLSGGQIIFLLSVYQFFCDSTVLELCSNTGTRQPTLPDIAVLDDTHRSVLLRLTDSYTGW